MIAPAQLFSFPIFVFFFFFFFLSLFLVLKIQHPKICRSRNLPNSKKTGRRTRKKAGRRRNWTKSTALPPDHPPLDPSLSRTAQNFAFFFFSLSRHDVHFSSLSRRVFSWNCGHGSRPWTTPIALFWAPWGHFVKPRRPVRCFCGSRGRIHQ